MFIKKSETQCRFVNFGTANPTKVHADLSVFDSEAQKHSSILWNTNVDNNFVQSQDIFFRLQGITNLVKCADIVCRRWMEGKWETTVFSFPSQLTSTK